MKTRIIEIIEQNYFDPDFDVNKLAEKLGICRSYLNTRFHFDFGSSPHDYLESVRIENAIKSLLEGDKIIEVCMKIGYANKKTFHVAFKKRFKMTPKEFVKKSKGTKL